MEAARWADYLGPAGVAVVNDQAIPPLSVVGDASAYPTTQDVERIIREHTNKVYFLPGLEIAEGLGNPQVLNVLLLGFLSSFLSIDERSYVVKSKLIHYRGRASLATVETTPYTRETALVLPY